MNCKALYFSELLTEQKVYLCLLCWGTATTFFTVPIKRESVTAQGSANKPVLASENPNLKLLLRFLHFLFWNISSGSANEALRSLQSPPSSLVFVLSILDMECPAGPQHGWVFSLQCSCSGLYAQSRFTHLHDCHCPLSLILGSHNVFTVLLIFPGSDSGGVPKCVSRPGSVFFFYSQQSVSKPFFPPFLCFCHSAALCGAS